MTWLTPLAGAILAAAVIPPLVLLYFLKLRRRPQAIASTMLWRKSIEDLHANAPFQKLRRSLLLLLQLIVLLLLAASIMQPMIHLRSQDGGRTVVMIDNSASMTAIDGDEDGKTRLDLAKTMARNRVEAMYAGGLFSRSPGETMVVAFSNRAEVMTRFTESKQQLLAAIDRIQPTHATSTIDEAFKLARAYTTNVIDPSGEARPIGEPPAILLYSDGRIADLDEQALRVDESLTFHKVGTSDPDNIAITAISVQRPYDRPNDVEVFAALSNFNPRPLICDIQLSINDVAPNIKAVDLPGAELNADTGVLIPGRNNVLFRVEDQPFGAVFGVSILRPDTLAADNEARVVVPPPKKLQILHVSSDRFLTRTVLEGMPLERLEIRTTNRYESLARDGGLERFDLVVFDGYAPESDALMPPGRYLTFGPTPPVEGLNAYGTDQGGFVISADEDHPIFQFVELDDLFIDRQTLLQPDDNVQVLAESTKGPTIVAVSRGRMQLIHVGFDPLDSNWPFLRSFVTFVFNAVEYLGHLGTTINHERLEPGQALTARLPASAREIQLQPPDGPAESLTTDPTQLSWGPIRTSGVYVVSWEQSGQEARLSRVIAVNILSEAESEIACLDEITIGSERTRAAGRTAGGYRPLWPWAIGLAIFMLMVEWWVYHRRAFV